MTGQRALSLILVKRHEEETLEHSLIPALRALTGKRCGKSVHQQAVLNILAYSAVMAHQV